MQNTVGNNFLLDSCQGSRFFVNPYKVEETDETCEELKQLLIEPNIFKLKQVLLIESPLNEDSEEQKIEERKSIKDEEPLDLDPRKFARVFMASVPILFGKTRFFKIVINAFPEVICLSKILSDNQIRIPIHTPLMCAIDNAKVASVKAVLKNKHFVSNEYKYQHFHEGHLKDCLAYATKSYANTMSAEEKTIIEILKSRINIRLPLNNNIKNSNIVAMREIFQSSVCRDFQKDYKDEYNCLIKYCINFAEKYCESFKKEEVIETLISEIT